MAGYSTFSFTALWARIGGAADKAVVAAGLAPRGVVIDLVPADRAVLAADLAPFVAELEHLRLDTLARVDARARWWVPLAGGGVALALLAAGQDLTVTMVFGLLAALVGWFMAMGRRASTYQTAVKARFAPVITQHLSGFAHEVEPPTDLAKLRGWHLFPELQSATTSDQVRGQRSGRPVLLSEMGIAYAPSYQRDAMDNSLAATVVETTVAAVTTDAVTLVLTPQDAPARVLAAQAKAAALQPLRTGDAAFDAVYTLRGSHPQAAAALGATLRSAILGLGLVAPAGRPYLVFQATCGVGLTVVFPTRLPDLAFHVPPYWVALDAEALLAQFASDIARKNQLIEAVLALPGLAAGR